jgi:carbamoyl-phosphate synthase small subunit
LNDGTVEGFSAENPFVECVQFHPEASPGPHDAFHIFENFFEKVRSRNAALKPHAVAAAAERTSDAQTV